MKRSPLRLEARPTISQSELGCGILRLLIGPSPSPVFASLYFPSFIFGFRFSDFEEKVNKRHVFQQSTTESANI